MAGQSTPMDSTSGGVERAQPVGAELAWTSHPLKQSRRKSLLLAGVMALTGVAIYLNTGAVSWALGSMGLLALGVHDFVLPTRYRMTTEAAESRILGMRRTKRWSALRSHYADHNGVLLSPFPKPSRLDTFRGLYIRYSGNSDEVLAFVRDRLQGRNA